MISQSQAKATALHLLPVFVPPSFFHFFAAGKDTLR